MVITHLRNFPVTTTGGKILYNGEFSIRRDKVTVDIGTIENHSEPTPVITTQASDAKTQYQIIKPSADTDIVDKVTITEYNGRQRVYNHRYPHGQGNR